MEDVEVYNPKPLSIENVKVYSLNEEKSELEGLSKVLDLYVKDLFKPEKEKDLSKPF